MQDPDQPNTSDAVILEGHLLRGRPDTVKLLVGGLYVEVPTEDLVTIDDVGDGAGSSSDFGIPVKVSLHRPVRLLEVGPGWPYAGLFKEGRRTFASSSRPWSPMPPRSSRYRELEQEFLRRHGLESEGGGG